MYDCACGQEVCICRDPRRAPGLQGKASAPYADLHEEYTVGLQRATYKGTGSATVSAAGAASSAASTAPQGHDRPRCHKHTKHMPDCRFCRAQRAAELPYDAFDC